MKQFEKYIFLRLDLSPKNIPNVYTKFLDHSSNNFDSGKINAKYERNILIEL